MDLNELFDLKPEELANKILERRQFLSQALPDIEARMAADADDLAPKVEKIEVGKRCIFKQSSRVEKTQK